MNQNDGTFFMTFEDFYLFFEKLYLCMRDLQPRIELEESLRLRALEPIERMLAIN